MSLSQQASQVAANLADEARQRQNEATERRIATRAKYIKDSLHYDPVWIDEFKYIFNIYEGSWQRGRHIVEYTYDRFRVDDVVVWMHNDTSIYLERPCERCGRPSIGSQNTLSLWQHQGNAAKIVADAMKPVTCAQCAEGLSRNCPTCGRSN